MIYDSLSFNVLFYSKRRKQNKYSARQIPDQIKLKEHGKYATSEQCMFYSLTAQVCIPNVKRAIKSATQLIVPVSLSYLQEAGGKVQFQKHSEENSPLIHECNPGNKNGCFVRNFTTTATVAAAVSFLTHTVTHAPSGMIVSWNKLYKDAIRKIML